MSKEYFRIPMSFLRKKLLAISFMTKKLWPRCDKNSVRDLSAFCHFSKKKFAMPPNAADRDGDNVVAAFVIIGLKIALTHSHTE